LPAFELRRRRSAGRNGGISSETTDSEIDSEIDDAAAARH